LKNYHLKKYEEIIILQWSLRIEFVTICVGGAAIISETGEETAGSIRGTFVSLLGKEKTEFL
jgi:hypothetical protein